MPMKDKDQDQDTGKAGTRGRTRAGREQSSAAHLSDRTAS